MPEDKDFYKTLFLPADTPGSIIRRADSLMYQSKRAGRNRVSVG